MLAREFGLVVARRIDEWAFELIGRTRREDTACTVSNLLALADWVSASQGYGNLILASRCQDVATIGIGRLVADLDYPISAVVPMVDRLDAPWRSALARAAVLNMEAGATVFLISQQQVESAQKRVEEIWQNGELLKLQADNPQVKAVFEGKKVPGFEAVAQMLAGRKGQQYDAPVSADMLDFFRDDEIAECARPVTTVSMWDMKLHRRLVFGFEPGNFRPLRALLRFRQFVGDFPQRIATTIEQEAAAKAEVEDAAQRGIKIISFESVYPSPGAAAFAKAWKPYANPGEQNLDVLAWQAYSAIKSGKFVDDDTRARRLATQPSETGVPNSR